MTDVIRIWSLIQKQALVWLLVLACASAWNGGSARAEVTETVLHSFTTGTDAKFPYAGVILGAGGNVYGTTWGGAALILMVVLLAVAQYSN